MFLKKIVKDLLIFIFLKSKGVTFQYGKVNLHGIQIINKFPGFKIILSNYVTIISNTKFNYAGINHKTIISTLSKDSSIIIGKYSGLSGASIVSAKKIEIGNNVGLGVNVNIWDTDFHPLNGSKRLKQGGISDAKSEEFLIGDNVWISANSTILKGTVIGSNTSVSTFSLVNKKFGSNLLIGCIPAKIIKAI
jgi:acetyltransferase-like isoleucine patch superfamily enzyme